VKRVLCANPRCSERRVHFTQQDINRNHQEIEVDNDFENRIFCSITCAMLEGSFSATGGWKDKHNQGITTQGVSDVILVSE